MKKAIIVYGPPGSGKGTQANLLADKLGLIHFDTGKYIEQVINDPANQKNPIIQREKKNFDAGILCTPSWVLKIIRKKTEELAKADFGVVFSGSPRTLFEAFGDKKNKGLIEILEKNYGKKNITPILLKVSSKASIKRNSGRLVCSVCKLPVLAKSCVEKSCPLCAASFRRRSLDTPEVIKVRLKQYRERTAPILKELKKRGYKIYLVNGEPLPYKVFAEILKKINE
jgi:adenylate kinase